MLAFLANETLNHPPHIYSAFGVRVPLKSLAMSPLCLLDNSFQVSFDVDFYNSHFL